MRDQNIGCHMNSDFVGADIQLLNQTHSSVMTLLNVCSNYVAFYAHDCCIIVLNLNNYRL